MTNIDIKDFDEYFHYTGDLTVNDGLVSITGSCFLKNSIDIDGTLPFKFDKIGADFICNEGKLKTLIGAPKYVGGKFDCSGNTPKPEVCLTSLEYSPIYVGGMFDCSGNRLTSLEYSPRYVGGTFDCCSNNIETLEGMTQTINGPLAVCFNKLKSLSGLPKSINGYFAISVREYTPLLKILMTKGVVDFIFFDKDACQINELEELFFKNYRTKNAVMKVGLEMMKRGYGNNARL